jgi:mannosyltransferase OCH1-like enzyme
LSIPVLISNRVLKIIGNTSKALCYGFHFFFPNKRFTIPERRAPLLRARKSTAIPKIVWQTFYTNRVTLPLYLNYLLNRLMTLDHEYRFVSDEAQLDYMRTQMPAPVADAYEKLLDGAAKADMWRASALYHDGGTYIDIDAHLVWPLSKLIKPEDTELIIFNRKDYSNFFMASQKGNGIMKDTIDLIVDNITHNKVGKGVYDLTGPSTLNKALENKTFRFLPFRYVCIQGSFTNEYFQYIDRPGSKWTHKKTSELLKKTP